MIRFLQGFEQELTVMKKLIMAIAAVGILASFAYSQKKPGRKTPVKKTSAPVALVPPLDVRFAREKVGIQLDYVNGYLAKLGDFPAALEQGDADLKANRLRPEYAAKVEKGKTGFVTTIAEMRKALSILEADFRTKTLLAKYLPTIDGVTNLAGQAEDMALAGKFVASKEPIRAVAQKLTDTLVALPK
jgi:hypothetical protein